MRFVGLLILGIIVFSVVSAFFQWIAENWLVVSLIAAIVPLYFLVRYIRMRRYFASPSFLEQKELIAAVVEEHNEISSYVDEIQASGRFSLGRSSTATKAHLASFENTSKFNYKRDKNVVDTASAHVHHCSLQVVRNASMEPIKYLIKYFDISATEEKLAEVEELGESISRLENAVANLRRREGEISEEIAPPKFILKHYLKKFQEQIGLSIPALSVPYPKYSFQYVSAGGNSSQVTDIRLDSETIDSVVETLAERIRFAKSAAGQRALMTAALREKIKIRDGYACKLCSVSVAQEPNLLLEIDHIKPVSKGGLSVEANLQALCWKCNRTKSNKDFSA